MPGKIPLTLAAIAAFAVAQQVPAVTFGDTVVVSGGLRGVIYYLKPATSRLPDFHRMKPAGAIYTSKLDVPPQSFTVGFPGVTTRFEWFAIDYTGRFWIEKPGDYRFSLTSDDGAKLWIDDQPVIDNDGEHPPREAQGDCELAHGIHRIRVAYFQGRRFVVALVLKIAAPGGDFRIFSTDEFKPPPEEWTDPRTAGERVVIDNDFVRVMKATLAPRVKTAPHENVLNRVIVYLDPGKIAIRYQDGRERDLHFPSGEAGWIAADGLHTEENTGRDRVRMIEIELKKPGPVTPPVRARSLDPVLIDRRHNKLLFENDQARVFRSWREPGATEPLHEHVGAGRVTVFMTDASATVRAGESESKLTAVAGDAIWSGPVKHAATNDGAGKMEMIVVEVK